MLPARRLLAPALHGAHAAEYDAVRHLVLIPCGRDGELDLTTTVQSNRLAYLRRTGMRTYLHVAPVSAVTYLTFNLQGVASISNMPGARQEAIPWTDASGNLWLFGGNGNDSMGNNGNLNDLWKYTP